jgi:NADH-quinone oxidoreductase subunit L
MTSLALVVLFAPIAALLLIAALPPLRRAGTAAGLVSSAFALTSLGAAIALLVQVLGNPAAVSVATINWLPHAGKVLAVIGVRADGVSATMAVVVALVASAVQVYSLGYMAHEERPAQGRYFAWQSLFLFSMLALVLAPDMLQFFLAWELVGLCSYLLIGFYYQKPSAARAAVKAFWVTKFADMALLVGIVLLHREYGTFSWHVVAAGPALSLVAVLFFVGAMGKSAQFPLHVWLPDAMEGPTPVSALLHAATMVAAGVYLVVRAWPIFQVSPEALTTMAWVGSITAFLAACMALVQEDIKKILAYSTCSQLGYMMAALGAGSMTAGFFHLTTHAFFKALLFLSAGALIHAVHSNNLSDMGGLRRKMPFQATLFMVGTAALIGIPGFSGFFSKDFILEALEHGHLWGPFALCLASVALTAFYMGRAVFRAFFGDRAPDGHFSTPGVMTAPMVVLAILALGAGWFGARLAVLWHGTYAFHVTPVGILATVLGLSGLGLAWLVYGSRVLSVPAFLSPLAAFIRSGPVDRLYLFGWNRGLLGISAACGFFDRYIVDGFVNLTGWVVLESGRRMRAVQSGKVQDYVFAVVLGFLILAAWGFFGDIVRDALAGIGGAR